MIYISGLSSTTMIPLSHSIYQKHAQLSDAKFTIKYSSNINLLLIDEAQDLNPCQFAIINTQIKLYNTTVVLVGDPNQAIYQFRGASDIHFTLWQAEETLHLTESFRFGNKISNICNIMLSLEKLYSRYELLKQWKPNNNSLDNTKVNPLVRGQSEIEDFIVSDSEATLEYPYTMLCRTNNCTYYR